MRNLLFIRFALLLVFGVGAAPTDLRADWSERPFNYIAIDQDLRQLLVDFAASEGIGIVISEGVSGTISGNFVNILPKPFMQEISATYGLIWYLFGGVLYVYDASESETRILNLANTPIKLVREALADLGIYDPRFDWRSDEELSMVLFTGPPRYVDLIEQVVTVVERERASLPRVAVFRLKYASASDRTITYRDQTVTVPGITTILQEISGVYGNNQGNGVIRSSGSREVARLPNLGAGTDSSGQYQQQQSVSPATASTIDGATAPASTAGQSGQGGQGSVRTTGNLTDDDIVRIETDTRLNAVIVKASSDRIPFFQQLIEELDQPSQLVQIDVTILDLATSRLNEIGVEWQLFDDVGFTSTIQQGITTGLQIAGSTSPNPFDLLADIRLLETEGDARIVSQPSVITFDGVEAVIDESESIYIRVAGDQDTSLYEVQTGTLLRVTPRMVNLIQENAVELFVEIRDGELDFDQEVDDIPTVDESTLTTTAVVQNGNGLLLGGLYRTTSIDVEDKIPVLGDIPILGLAFRSKSVTETSVARLFLLTPQVIQLDRSTERVDLTPQQPNRLSTRLDPVLTVPNPAAADSKPVTSEFGPIDLDGVPEPVAPLRPLTPDTPAPGQPRLLVPLQRLSAEPAALLQLSAAACEASDYAILPGVLSFDRASDWVRCSQQSGGHRSAAPAAPSLPDPTGLY